MLDERILRNHDHLSPQCGELTRDLCADEHAHAFQVDLAAAGLPRFLAEYAYPVSPWPLLISSAVKATFADIVREAPSLIGRAILRFYERDLAAFSAHYRVPEIVYHLLADVGGEATDALVRYDIALVGTVPKILEVNVGSKCGGWQLGWLWKQAADLVERRKTSPGWYATQTNTVEAFFRHLQHAVHAHVGDTATGNILLMLDPYFINVGFDQDLAAIHARVVAASARPGKLRFDVGFDGVAFQKSGGVTHRGEPVDCVLTTSNALRGPVELARAHIRRRVFYPDNPVHRVIADKTNFAMLHTLRAAGRLSSHDADLVDAYIPWAAFLSGDSLAWQETTTSGRDLARAHKDEFVIKRGMSYQGREVFVGRFLPDDEWAAAIEKAAAGDEWVLQTYCPPDRLYAPDGAGGVAEHESIWGVFGFGQKYGGGFVRLMAVAKGQGVINSARGARECVILEVREAVHSDGGCHGARVQRPTDAGAA